MRKGTVLKCYIYGIGMQYNMLSSYLYSHRDEIEILALVTTNPQNITYLDGKRVIRPCEMKIDEMDYVIVAMEQYKEVLELLKRMGLSGKILRSSVFSIPNFVLNDYLKIKESRPSILSNTCLAGFVYHDLGLEMLSPTINMRCKNYIDFLENYERLLSIDMIVSEKTGFEEGFYEWDYTFAPQGLVGNSVYWQFIHAANSNDEVKKWNRRRHYINYKNIIALMVIMTDEDAYKFENLPIERKLGFYYKDLKLKSVVYTPEWNDPLIQGRYQFCYSRFIHNFYGRNVKNVGKVNWIKFFNVGGGDDFLRY